MLDIKAKENYSVQLGRWTWYLFLATVAISVLSGILLFLPPWRVYATDRYRLFCIVILILVSGIAFFGGGIRSNFPFHLGKLGTLGVAVFSISGFASSLLAPFPRYALLEWAYFMGAAILGLGVYQSVLERKSRALTGLNQAVFFAVYTYSLFYLFWYFSQIKCRQLFCVQLLLPGFDNPRTFDSLFLPLMLLYPLTINYLPRSGLIRLAYWVLGAVWFSLLFVSSSRTNYLAILLLCPLAFCIAPHTAFPWLKRLGVFLLLGGLAYWLIHAGWPLLAGAQAEAAAQPPLFATGSFHARIELWHRAFLIFLAHPLMGAGPMHFSFYGDIPHVGEGANPHNLTLQLLSEWGLICTVLFYANILLLLGKAVRYLRRPAVSGEMPDGVFILALLAAWSAMLLAAQTSGSNMLMIAGFGATLAGWVIQEKDGAGGKSHSAWRLWLLVMPAMVIIFLLNGVYPEAGCRLEEDSAYLKAYPEDTAASPRFWSQGKIAFAHHYLPECYKDAERLFAGFGWN